MNPQPWLTWCLTGEAGLPQCKLNKLSAPNAGQTGTGGSPRPRFSTYAVNANGRGGSWTYAAARSMARIGAILESPKGIHELTISALRRALCYRSWSRSLIAVFSHSEEDD